MVQKIEGEGDCFRCDFWNITSRISTVDVTEVPLIDIEDVVRSAMPYGAKVARIIQHPAGVELGRCVCEVKPRLAEVVVLADRFNSRRAFTGDAW